MKGAKRLIGAFFLAMGLLFAWVLCLDIFFVALTGAPVPGGVPVFCWIVTCMVLYLHRRDRGDPLARHCECCGQLNLPKGHGHE